MILTQYNLAFNSMKSFSSNKRGCGFACHPCGVGVQVLIKYAERCVGPETYGLAEATTSVTPTSCHRLNPIDILHLRA